MQWSKEGHELDKCPNLSETVLDLILLFATLVKVFKDTNQAAFTHHCKPHIPIAIFFAEAIRLNGIVITVKVIQLALLRVTEHIIGLRNLLELGLKLFLPKRVLIMVLIWAISWPTFYKPSSTLHPWHHASPSVFCSSHQHPCQHQQN